MPTPEVVMEIKKADEWLPLATLAESDPCGSLSSEEPEGRQVYVFGWINGVSGLWRSLGGIDLENPELRLLSSIGLDPLSYLDEPYELVRYSQMGMQVRLRFRVQP